MTDTAITLYEETEKVASAMVKSGYFQDSRDVSQAIVKILAGREMGFGAFASMTGVYIIQGRPSVGANLMASAVKRSGRYDYRVMEMTDQACEIQYLQAGKEIGRSRFTIDDARKAQTKNLDKFPRNMLFARAMSNGVRWYCPDVFDGAPVYTPEELGADVTESGDVIPGTFTEVKPPAQPAPAAPKQPAPVTVSVSTVNPATAAHLEAFTGEAMPEQTVTMTLDDALALTRDGGQKYGEIDNETLSHMANSLTKTLKSQTMSAEERATRERKLAGIKIILAHREAK